MIQKKQIETQNFALRLSLAGGRQKGSVHVTFSGMVSLFWNVKRNKKNIKNFKRFSLGGIPLLNASINKQNTETKFIIFCFE